MKRACPECKDPMHLYVKLDLCWDEPGSKWEGIEEVGDFTSAECTTCDWEGTVAETEVEGGADAAG